MVITVDGFVIISPQSVAGFVKFTLSLKKLCWCIYIDPAM